MWSEKEKEKKELLDDDVKNVNFLDAFSSLNYVSYFLIQFKRI